MEKHVFSIQKNKIFCLLRCTKWFRQRFSGFPSRKKKFEIDLNSAKKWQRQNHLVPVYVLIPEQEKKNIFRLLEASEHTKLDIFLSTPTVFMSHAQVDSYSKFLNDNITYVKLFVPDFAIESYNSSLCLNQHFLQTQVQLFCFEESGELTLLPYFPMHLAASIQN